MTGTEITVDPPASGSESHYLEYWSTDAAGNVENHTGVNFNLYADGDDTHTIRVRVMQNGEPAEGVDMVICTATDPSVNYADWEWNDHVFTDADGYAEWPDMPGVEGGYRVRAADFSVRTFIWQAVPGYVGGLPEPELDLDADSMSYVHIRVIDADGNAIEGAQVQAEFENSDLAQDAHTGDDAVATSDSSGNANLDLTSTHQALRARAVIDGVTYYGETFHPDTYGYDYGVDVVVP